MPVDDPLLPLGDGSTALSDDDRQGLKLTYITTRGELNEAEQANILRAVTSRRSPTAGQLLDDLYLRKLHRDMFGDVWTWAGRYRLRETNLGVEPGEVGARMRDLVADTAAQIKYGVEDPDHLAARFHHRLVSIHPFPNGNGRHGRIAADYLSEAVGQRPFTWGRNSGDNVATLRANYLRALRDADNGNISTLVTFART